MSMKQQPYKVAGYVKLAKLWERNRDKALAYHERYYMEKFIDDEMMQLQDVYIDITGQKDLRKRKSMIRLLGDCMSGKVNCIATQTRAYLAANNRELFYLLYFLFKLPDQVEIITEDDNYHIDTIVNEDDQRQALITMAEDYIKLNPDDYKSWEHEILQAVSKSTESRQVNK